jgi:hypothetical protein
MYSVSIDANGVGSTEKHPPDVDVDKAIQPHIITHANMSSEDSKTFARNKHNEFMLHEWVVTATVAGPQILKLKPTAVLNVLGMGNNIMGGYYQFDSIEHQIDFHRGYKGILRGKWGKTDNGVNAPAAGGAGP